jgi:hypothetical protein
MLTNTGSGALHKGIESPGALYKVIVFESGVLHDTVP